MNYLRYSSDEMFSSTELIRKSKKVFDKLNKKEIEKAIILRDGKPGFLLLDFDTYETIMKDYEKLKSNVGKKQDEQYLSLDDIEVSSHKKEKQVVSTPIKVEENIEEELLVEELEDKIEEEENIVLQEITQLDQIPTDEIDDEELVRALAEIEEINMSAIKSDNNTDSDSLSEENSDFEDDLNIDLESLETTNTKQPLKEFWDN